MQLAAVNNNNERDTKMCRLNLFLAWLPWLLWLLLSEAPTAGTAAKATKGRKKATATEAKEAVGSHGGTLPDIYWNSSNPM